MKTWLALAAATALTLTSLTAWLPPQAARAASISPPVHHGTLRVSGVARDGATVAAAGLHWHAPRLPRGMSLLSFEVAYSWQSCDAAGTHCRAGADSPAAPFAARRYAVGHADTGRRLRLTETASEVVQTQRNPFTFQVIRRSVSALTAAEVRAYPRHKPPVTAFVNGTPESDTASTQEYFQVAAPHANPADGTVTQRYRIDFGPWRAMPQNRVFYTGTLEPGPHQVAVRTASRAGATEITFGWQIDPPTPPLPCQSSGHGACWYPPHLDRTGHPMRWDWQIGRTTPLQRTGRNAVDIYDIDGFLTTRAQVTAITTRWQAKTLTHPRTVCYLDLAWEDYRPDATPGTDFAAAALGNIYFGFPEERWVDLRQLDALKPMLRERVAMCARKGFERGRTGRHRQLRPAVHHRLPPHPGRRAELPGLRVQPDPPGRDDRAVEELALPVLVGAPVRGRRGGGGVLPGPRLLRLPVQGQPPVRDHLHRAVRRHAVRLGRLHRRRPVGR